MSHDDPSQNASPYSVPPGQGQYGQGQYGQAQFNQPQQQPQQSRGSGLGQIAFILAIVTLGVELLGRVVTQILIYTGGGLGAFAVANNISIVLTLLLGIATLVLAIIGLRRQGASVGDRVRAGIALGISITLLAGILVALFSGFLGFVLQ